MPLSRKQIIKKFHQSIHNNRPLVGVASGSGFSAKRAIEGGADFLLALNAGCFRNFGLSSIAGLMPFDNSNRLVMDLGTRQLLPLAKDCPVIFGACATDPTYPANQLISDILKHSFAGVTNFPTVGLIDGKFREALEEDDLGYDREVEFLQRAVAEDLLTIAFVFNLDQAVKMAKSNVDILCAHLGWTVGGSNPFKHTMTLEDSIRYAQNIYDIALEINPRLIPMAYGGPINTPEAANYFYAQTSAVGYIGGSTFERIPSETSITETTEKFKKYISLQAENEYLKRELRKKLILEEIIGHSAPIRDVLNIVYRVADKNINVLIQGESGTGKELIAKALHTLSERRNHPFIKINCASLNESLIESELFGHEKGAFTGAISQRLGRFELADGGTLFLDEIGELSINLQAKLLRVLQQREFERVGGTKTIQTDVRIISATNVNLLESVKQGTFREDLYYRLNVVTITAPPLRERKDDIPLLISHFIKKINQNYGMAIKRLTPEALSALMAYPWPGNVRELENVLSRLGVLTDGETITLEMIRQNCPTILTFEELAPATFQEASPEKEELLRALESHQWNREKTANALGISRKTLYNRMKRLGIHKH